MRDRAGWLGAILALVAMAWIVHRAPAWTIVQRVTITTQHGMHQDHRDRCVHGLLPWFDHGMHGTLSARAFTQDYE